MSWFRVDDRFHSHPKVMRAGTAAAGLFIRCGSYSAEHLTDGFVPAEVARQYGSTEWARSLVDAGLWVIVADGYAMPDYLDYNPSREQVLDERRKAAERQRRARDRAQEKALSQGKKAKGSSRRDSRVSHTSSHGSVTGPPTPSSPKGEGEGRAPAPLGAAHALPPPTPRPDGQEQAPDIRALLAEARARTDAAKAKHRAIANGRAGHAYDELMATVHTPPTITEEPA